MQKKNPNKIKNRKNFPILKNIRQRKNRGKWPTKLKKKFKKKMKDPI